MNIKEEMKKKSKDFRNRVIESKGNLGDQEEGAMVSSDEEISAEELKASLTTSGDSLDVQSQMDSAREMANDLKGSADDHAKSALSGRKEKTFGSLAHLMARPNVVAFDLPCGYGDFGKLHNAIDICRMLGSDKRKMQSEAGKGNLAEFKNSILISSLVSLGKKWYNKKWLKTSGKKIAFDFPDKYENLDIDIIENMCIPDRLFVMWKSFMLAGMKDDGTSPVTLSFPCPDCEKTNSIKYDMAKTDFTTAEAKGLKFDEKENCWYKVYENEELKASIKLRLGTGHTQRTMARFAKKRDIGGAIEVLTEYAILEINGIPRDELESIQPGLTVKKFLDMASDDVLNWIDWCIGDMSPGPEGDIEFDCIHCGAEINQRVNVDSFLARTHQDS